MASWNYFRRTFAQSTIPTSPNHPVTQSEQEETVSTNPWLEILMQWDDFEQWQLKMMDRSWWLSATA
ncbi:unnamed protein product [Aureobasidium vineae]|uniref:Uncharacterized protein n=1 Tax=Aureobasidium vineae TaxID=2773715 RepID=A0A9N8JDE9_9PEZI|nr:unnamed protein product [Aureobasidium vineae]